MRTVGPLWPFFMEGSTSAAACWPMSLQRTVASLGANLPHATHKILESAFTDRGVLAPNGSPVDDRPPTTSNPPEAPRSRPLESVARETGRRRVALTCWRVATSRPYRQVRVPCAARHRLRLISRESAE